MNFFNRFSSIIYFRYNYLLTLIRLSAIILLEIAQKAVLPLVSDEITQQKGARGMSHFLLLITLFGCLIISNS